MNEDKIILHNRIRELLLVQGFTPADLSTALGVSYSQVYRWMENRTEPRPKMRRKICDMLGAPAHTVFYIKAEDGTKRV